MSSRFFQGPAIEPSLRTGFAGNVIDRNAEHRSDEDLVLALRQPHARIMLTLGDGICLRAGDAGYSPDFSVGEAIALQADLKDAVLLGHDGKVPVLMTALADTPALPESVEIVDFRAAYSGELLAPDRAGAMAQGISLLTWNRTHRFCGRCGGPTRMRDGGYRRSCTGCEADHFPRTDPVVIMLALDGENCLLGRSPRFKPGMYSCLAGFLEPGETIEAAVRRETREEAGISIGRVAYHASQPWPFPHTLMIGCYGEALSRKLTIDRNELEDCRWFSRREVCAMLAGEKEELSLPPKAAIAHLLVADWAKRE